MARDGLKIFSPLGSGDGHVREAMFFLMMHGSNEHSAPSGAGINVFYVGASGQKAHQALFSSTHRIARKYQTAARYMIAPNQLQ